MRETITSWGVALKRRSNQLIIAAGLLPVFWIGLPEAWQKVVLEWNDGILVLGATALAGAAFFYSNLKQPELEEEMREAYAVDETDCKSDFV